MALTKYERNKRWRKNRSVVWNSSKRRYHRKSRLTAFNARQSWTVKDCNQVLSSNYMDSQLAILIGRSVKAIQLQRIKLKKRK